MLLLTCRVPRSKSPQLLTDLICDLGLGELTHEQLAEKYGRSPDAIHQFSSRNKDEIRRAKRDMGGEWAGLFTAKKRDRISGLEQCLLNIEEALQDPNPSHSQRNRYINTVAKLYHNVAEELGELPLRVAIEIDNPLLSYTINGVDMDEVFAPSESGMRRHSGSPVPDQSEPETSPAPGPEPAGPMSSPVAPEPESPATPVGEMKPSAEDRAYLRWLNS